MKDWNNAEEVFGVLNNTLDYLVLRNHEEFYGSILSDSHADIDVLCRKSDKKTLINLLDAKPRLKRDDGIHYQFKIEGEYIPLDIRYIGDGYYDGKWESDMMGNRCLDSRGFYRMSTDDYFWSLLYHSIYHKGKISDEYYGRLSKFKPDMFPASQKELEEKLYSYMLEKGYFYTIARDKYLWYYFTELCEGRIKAYPFYKVRIFFLKCKEYVLNKVH